MSGSEKYGHYRNRAKDLGKKAIRQRRGEKGDPRFASTEPVNVDASWKKAFLSSIDQTVVESCPNQGLKITPNRGGGTYVAIERLDLINALVFFDIDYNVEQPAKWIKSVTIPPIGIQTILKTFDPFGRGLHKPEYDQLRTILTSFRQAPPVTNPDRTSLPGPTENAL